MHYLLASVRRNVADYIIGNTVSIEMGNSNTVAHGITLLTLTAKRTHEPFATSFNKLIYILSIF